MLDPSIILAGKPLQLNNPIEMAQQGLNLKNMGEIAQQNQYKTIQAQRANSDEDIVRKAYSQNMKIDDQGNPTVDRQGTLRDIFAMGAPERGLQQQSQWQSNDIASQKMLRENQKAALDNAKLAFQNQLDQHNRKDQLLGASTDEESYIANSRQAQLEGLIPPGPIQPYSPDLIRSYRIRNLNSKDQTETSIKNIELLQKQQGLGEEERFHRATVGEAETHHEGEYKIGMAKAGYEVAQNRRDAEHKINEELQPYIVDYEPVRDTWKNMQGMSKTKGGLSDIGLLEGMVKLYNPKATIKQGTVNMFLDESMGIPSHIVNMWNKYLDHPTPLTPQVRNQLMSESKNIYDSRTAEITNLIQQQRSKAVRQQLNPENIGYNFDDKGFLNTSKPTQPTSKYVTPEHVQNLVDQSGGARSYDEIISALKSKGYEVR